MQKSLNKKLLNQIEKNIDTINQVYQILYEEKLKIEEAIENSNLNVLCDSSEKK